MVDNCQKIVYPRVKRVNNGQNGALGDFTPAQKAGIRFPFKNWLDVVNKGGYHA